MAFCQGEFTPRHPSKYIGKMPIFYRSLPERRLMAFADINPRVVKWSSESIVVPYIKPTDGKLHRYYIDFTMEIRTEDGKTIKYLVEYKPHKQSVAPKPSSKKKPKTLLSEQMEWAINQSKWQSATAYAKKNGWQFMIVTERDLG